MHARHTVYTISPSPDATLAIEITQTGFAKRKRLFVFEHFTGELIHNVHDPLSSILHLDVEASSFVCRDPGASVKQRERSTRLTVQTMLKAEHHARLQIDLQQFFAKPLRGFTAEGKAVFRGSDHAIKCNVGFGAEKKGRLQIDIDAVVRLSDFDVACPAFLFGLRRTNDDAVLHALLWGVAETTAESLL